LVLSLHHSLDLVHNPAIFDYGTELPRDRNWRSDKVGRAASVSVYTACGDDSSICRRQGDDGTRLCARGLRMFYGRAAYARLDRHRLFAVSVFTGCGPIAWSYLAGLVRFATPGAKRDIYLRRSSADRAAVRCATWERFCSNIRAHPRADLFQS